MRALPLDDAVRHGNNPYRCACTGSDVRSTLPGLHAGLQQRRQLHRVWLILDNRWNKLFEDKSSNSSSRFLSSKGMA